jgi:chorismate synthase
VDEKLDGRIAQAILSIHAVKAVAIGDGVAAAHAPRARKFTTRFYFDEERRYHRTTNRAGGLEGGVTNGQDVVVRAFMKPISTLRRGLPSVDTRRTKRIARSGSAATSPPFPHAASCARRCWRSSSPRDAREIRRRLARRDARNYDAYVDELRLR